MGAAKVSGMDEQGVSWTDSGFQSSWQKVKKRLERDKAVQPGLTLKGLRHTFATILAEMGVGDATIAAYLGHKTTKMARHYSRDAERSRRIKETVLSMDAELDASQAKVVNPPRKVSTPEDEES